MNFMNYKTFRILGLSIVGIFLMIIFIILKKNMKKNYDSNKKYIVTILIVIYFIYYFNSFDALIINFKSLDNAFRFFRPNTTIIKKYVFDNYAYIEYGNNGYHNIIYFKKNNNKWKIGNVRFGNIKHKTLNKKIAIFYIYETPEQKDIIIFNYYIHNTEDSKKKAKKTHDSLNSKISTNIYEINSNTCRVLQSILLNNKMNEDYKIYIGDLDFSIGG